MEEQDLFGSDAIGKNGAGLKVKRKRKRSGEDVDGGGNRGICYLSRLPPRMDPSHVRQILSQYGEIQRIYLAPEGNPFIHDVVVGWSDNQSY